MMVAVISSLVEIQETPLLERRAVLLKSIKNEVIGNESKKVTWMNTQLPALLADILSSTLPNITTWSGKEGDFLLDVVILFGLFAQDDASILYNEQIEHILTMLIDALRHPHTNRAISIAILRILNNLANFVVSVSEFDHEVTTKFTSIIYSQQALRGFTAALQPSTRKLTDTRHIEMIANVLIQTCNGELQRSAVESCGLLDVLVAHVAHFGDFLQPHNKESDAGFSQLGGTPSVDKLTVVVAILLRAISIVILGSSLRARTFLNQLNQQFRNSTTNVTRPPSPSTERAAPVLGSDQSGNGELGEGLPRDILAMVNIDIAAEQRAAPLMLYGDSANGKLDPSPSVRWLLNLIHCCENPVRLMAVSALTQLLHSVSNPAIQEISLVQTFIPMLVRMLRVPTNYEELLLQDQSGVLLASMTVKVLEEAANILVTCMDEEPVLIKASFEAGAISQLAMLLKMSQSSGSEDRSRAFWRPRGSESVRILEYNNSRKHPMTPSRPRAWYAIQHQWRIRQATLRALASISSQKDEYRKAVIEEGVVPLLVGCLKPLVDNSFTDIDKAIVNNFEDSQAIGNPTPVLLASCELAKTLSRSVSALRTSLSDADLASPLIPLLSHSKIDVQTAATAAVCNVVLEFSPMRDAAVKAGVVDILCRHTKSAPPKLKLHSLWALKHLVHMAPSDLRMECLRKLGTEWLRQVLNLSPSSSSDPYVSPGSSRLNDDEHEEVHMIEDPRTHLQATSSWRLPPQDYSAAMTESGVRSDEGQDSDGHHILLPREELAIREQAFLFIRNLLADGSSDEMADYVVRVLGPNELVDTLAQMLTRLSGCQGFGKLCHLCLLNSDELLVSLLYIICNLAGTSSTHQQTIATRGVIVSKLLPLMRHRSTEIRLICVWIFINLTAEHDQRDSYRCKARALDLRKAGVLESLQELTNDDNLDVRERAATAIRQIKDHLGG